MHLANPRLGRALPVHPGLGALIGGIRRIRESEGRVVIFSDRDAITKLLHTTGFDRIVPVTETVDEAIAAVVAPPI